MTKWQRKQKREAAKAKKVAIKRRADMKSAVKLMAAIIKPMNEYTQWQKERVRVLRKALDVLAGESASS